MVVVRREVYVTYHPSGASTVVVARLWRLTLLSSQSLATLGLFIMTSTLLIAMSLRALPVFLTVVCQEAMDGAAKEGHIWVVLWLHENTTAGATKSAMVRYEREG